MKRLLIFLLFVYSLTANIIAQHCPFDGGNMIAVHVTDRKGKPVANAYKYLKLVEINNPNPQKCTYAEGILRKDFLPTKQYLQKYYEGYWKSWIEPNYTDWQFYNPGFFVVTLNQAENSCMIKNENDFKYKRREFSVRFQKNSGKAVIVNVPRERIYSLCTNNGKWTRIVPIELKTIDLFISKWTELYK